MGQFNKQIAYSTRNNTCKRCGGNFTTNFYDVWAGFDRLCYICIQKQNKEKQKKKQQKEREEKGHGDFE